jgi:synaptic vesicle membrane protein VAT-1
MDQITSTTVIGAGLAALVFWRWLQPRPALPTPLGLDERAPACVACGVGGYDALSAAALGADGTTRAALKGIESVAAADLVTVRVAAAGVNYADVCLRWGLYASWNEFGGGQRPGLAAGAKGDVPGFEFSGTVAAVAEGASHGLAVGDEVFGVTLFGAYSSKIAVPAHQLFKRPAALMSAVQAAALPSVAMTAWFAVQQQAQPIARGHWVLVHSAAGGVGSMLVQICKLKGWRVLGVVGGAHKVSACEQLGADAVVDKSSTDLWAEARRVAPEGFAAVFDANGVGTIAQSYEHLAPCGKLIVYGFHTMLPRQGGVIGPAQWLAMARDYLRTPRFNPLHMTAANKSVLSFNLSFLFDRRDYLARAMGEILTWIASGELKVPKVTEFALDDVRAAHAALESGTTVGKLVLIPPNSPL